MGTDQGALDGALQTLLAQHQAACDCVSELARELEAARARMKMLAEAVQATAQLLPEDHRARAEHLLSTQETVPLPGGTKIAAMRAFLRVQDTDFTPTDLARWLARTGHPVKAPRAAARLLHVAAERGLVKRLTRGRYRVAG